MYQGSTVAVVVPAYNEERFVGDVLDDVPSFVDRVYAVDDCSTDATWAVIRSEADETQSRPPDWHPAPVERVARSVTPEPAVGRSGTRADAVLTGAAGGQQLLGRDEGQSHEQAPAATAPAGTSGRILGIRHEENAGVGGAIKTGYRQALAEDVDVVAVVNGDGQMDASLLDSLIDPLVAGAADYAKGNRLATAQLRAQMPPLRQFGNVLLTGLTRVTSGYWRVTDAQNGYTAITTDMLERLDVGALYDDYGFLNDVLVRLNVHDARIVDVPMPAVYGEEESGIEYSSFVPMLSLLLLTRFLWRLRSEVTSPTLHPAAFMYGVAALTGIAGLGYVGVAVATDPQSASMTPPLAMLALCPAAVVLAVLLERRGSSDLEAERDPEFSLEDRS